MFPQNCQKFPLRVFSEFLSEIITKIISATRPRIYCEKVPSKIVAKRAFRCTDQLQACLRETYFRKRTQSLWFEEIWSSMLVSTLPSHMLPTAPSKVSQKSASQKCCRKFHWWFPELPENWAGKLAKAQHEGWTKRCPQFPQKYCPKAWILQSCSTKELPKAFLERILSVNKASELQIDAPKKPESSFTAREPQLGRTCTE